MADPSKQEFVMVLPDQLDYTDRCSGSKAVTNERGIPLAPFVDKVEDYVSSRADVEKTLKNFEEMIS